MMVLPLTLNEGKDSIEIVSMALYQQMMAALSRAGTCQLSISVQLFFQTEVGSNNQLLSKGHGGKLESNQRLQAKAESANL